MDSASPPAVARRLWLRWLPFVAFTAFVACVIASANTGTMPRVFAWIGRQPFGDKIAHFVLIGTITFLLDHALAGRRVTIGRWRVGLALLLVAVVMTIEEFSQLWIPGRDFELGDLAANYAGIAVAALAARWIGPAGSQSPTFFHVDIMSDPTYNERHERLGQAPGVAARRDQNAAVLRRGQVGGWDESAAAPGGSVAGDAALPADAQYR
jgi:VanZ family protein